MIVTETLGGGTVRHTDQLMSALRARGIPALLAVLPDGPPIDHAWLATLPAHEVLDLSNRSKRDASHRAWQAIRRATPRAVVFAKGAPSDIPPMLELRTSLRYRSVLLEHLVTPKPEQLPLQFFPPKLGLYRRIPAAAPRWLARLAAVIWINSTLAASLLESTWSIPQRRVRVIPLGADPELFCRDQDGAQRLRAERGIPPGAFVLGLVTRPELHIKGLDLAAQGIAQFAATHDGPLHVVFAGIGSRDELKGLGRDLTALEQRATLHFLGNVRNPQRLAAAYSAMDALLMSARLEGGPLCVLESMSCETPVIATPVGDVPEVVAPDNGVTVGDFSAEAVATAIAQFAVLDERARRQMGVQARKRIIATRSVAQHFERLLAAILDEA